MVGLPFTISFLGSSSLSISSNGWSRYLPSIQSRKLVSKRIKTVKSESSTTNTTTSTSSNGTQLDISDNNDESEASPTSIMQHDHDRLIQSIFPRRIHSNLDPLGVFDEAPTIYNASSFEIARRYVNIVSSHLDTIAELNTELYSQDSLLSTPMEDPFCSEFEPRISLGSYLFRAIRCLNLWREEETTLDSFGLRSLLMTLCYYRRMVKENPWFKLNRLNCHRFMIIGMLIASKLTEDQFSGDGYASKVACVSVSDLERMERHFCSMLKYRLIVSRDDFDSVYQSYANLTIYQHHPQESSAN